MSSPDAGWASDDYKTRTINCLIWQILNVVGGQVEPVLGGKANLDFVKPHSFAFELLA
jgi:hypothetical protein